MELSYRQAIMTDAALVFQAVGELLDRPLFSLTDFEIYWSALLRGDYGKCDVWLAFVDGTPCAYILANYSPIPRYLGMAVELEEVVTLPMYQRKGIGRDFLNFLKVHYVSNRLIRKITVKTDDHSESGRLYADLFQTTDMRFYQKFLNKL